MSVPQTGQREPPWSLMIWIALRVQHHHRSSTSPTPSLLTLPQDAQTPMSGCMHCPRASSCAPRGTPAATDSLTSCTGEQLAHWALQFSPHVLHLPPLADAVLRTQQHCTVLMEAASCLRLWGGLDGLLAQLRAGQALGMDGMAWARTALLAQAYLWLRVDAQHPPPDDDLPLKALQAALPHRITLAQMGITAWGQLRTMPRGGITRRFGRDLLHALDQALGQTPWPCQWLVQPEVFDVQHELAANVEHAEGLMFVAARQLQLLRAWLRSRHQGALSLRLIWQLDARRDVPPTGELILSTAVATQDMAHVQRLLAEALARTELPAPAQALRLLALRTEALPQTSATLLLEEQRQGEPLHQFIERVASKLGADAVQQGRLQADHRPECSQQWHRAAHTSPRIQRSVDAKHQHPIPQATNLRPPWMLAAPLRLMVRQNKPHYHGPLKLLSGPERIEVSALVDAQPMEPTQTRQQSAPGAVARDYFVAISAHAGLLWVFRERTRLEANREVGWFLHGVFG
jgi:protein ImuB